VPLGRGVEWGGASECFDRLGQEKDRVSVNMPVKQGWAPRLLFGARAAGVYLRSDSRHLVFQSSRAVSTQKDGPELVPRRTLIGSSTFLARDVRCRVHLTRSQNEPHPNPIAQVALDRTHQALLLQPINPPIEQTQQNPHISSLQISFLPFEQNRYER
jgi:hypothetical protein